MSGQESKYDQTTDEDKMMTTEDIDLYIPYNDDGVDTEYNSSGTKERVNESKLADQNMTIDLEDVLSRQDIPTSDDLLFYISKNFEQLTKYFLLSFGSTFKHKIMAVNAWKILTINAYQFSDIFFQGTEYLVILFDGFFHSTINSLIAYDFFCVLSQLVNINPDFLPNYFSNNNFIRKFLYNNMQYDGILDITLIFLDTVNDFLLYPTIKDCFDELITTISTIDDYFVCRRFIQLLRAILARGSWNSDSYASPVCSFYRYIIDNKQINAFLDLLISSKNEYESLVILSYIDKITNYDIDDKIINFGSQETPYYGLPFISNKDRKSFTIDTNVKVLFYNLLPQYLATFLSKNVLQYFSNRKLSIIPHTIKMLYSILDNIFPEVELDQMLSCYIVFVKLYPYMIGYNYPLLGLYCLNMCKRLLNHKDLQNNKRVSELLKTFNFDINVVVVNNSKEWMNIYRNDVIISSGQNNGN